MTDQTGSHGVGFTACAAVPGRSRRQPVPGELLLHPVALIAIAVVIFNDRYLKLHHPGIISGKLSDVGGLIYFPLFVVSLIEVVCRLTHRRQLDGNAEASWGNCDPDRDDLRRRRSPGPRLRRPTDGCSASCGGQSTRFAQSSTAPGCHRSVASILCRIEPTCSRCRHSSSPFWSPVVSTPAGNVTSTAGVPIEVVRTAAWSRYCNEKNFCALFSLIVNCGSTSSKLVATSSTFAWNTTLHVYSASG